MTNDERDRQMVETATKVASIHDWIRDLHKDIRGNGQPGLIDRLTVVETLQKTCPAREEQQGESKRQTTGLYVGAFAAIAGLAAVIVAWIK